MPDFIRFVTGALPGPPLPATYDGWLVALSFLVASLAAYTAIDLSGRVARFRAEPRRALAWLLGGAFAMGAGIWSMHFVAMLAYKLPIPVRYEQWTTLASMLAAIATSGFAIYIITRGAQSWRRLILSGTIMGAGIGTMHYTGMAAMRMDALVMYYVAPWLLSIANAIVCSILALWIVFRLGGPHLGSRILAAVVMGVAICGMHYTGMYATVCVSTAQTSALAGLDPGPLAAAITAVTLLIIGMALTASLQSQLMTQAGDRFALLLNSSAEGIYGMSPSSDCTFVNEAGASMLGYDPAELVGRPIHDLIHHHRADGRPYPLGECKIAKAAREGTKIRVEDEVFWHKNGVPVPVAYSVNPMIVGDRNQGAVITFSDISERQRSELALRTSEEKVRLAARAAQLGIWTWFVTDDRVVWENDRMYEIVGFNPTDKPISAAQFATELLHPEDAPRFKEALSQAVESGVRFFFEGRFYRVADKSHRWIEFTGLLQTASGEHPERLLGTAADITERKLHEETIRKYAAEISAEDRRKTEFLAILAHELRNPLAPLRNGLHLLAGHAGDKELLDRTRTMMERQVNQLVRLVDDLLDISRVTSGKIDLQKAPARLQDVIGLAIETSMPLIQAQKHELIVNLPASQIIVEVDSARIAQVVSNLLNNAAKYTRSGGRIILTAAILAEGTATITVEDTGIGIPTEVLGSIFQMFSQVARTLDRSHGGLGIGLSLVRRLVELHGGTVQVESPGPGLGSKFTVTLPVGRRPSCDSCSPDLPDSRVRPNSSLKVLVVDDNADAADTLASILEHEGHRVWVARDGNDAIEQVREFSPRVVFLDIGMPVKSGYEVASELRAHEATRGIVLVALTGWGAAEDRARAIEAGFDHHLTKPADVQVVQKILRNINAQQRNAARDPRST